MNLPLIPRDIEISATAFQISRRGYLNHPSNRELTDPAALAANRTMPALSEALFLLGPEFALAAETCQQFGVECSSQVARRTLAPLEGLSMSDRHPAGFTSQQARRTAQAYRNYQQARDLSVPELEAAAQVMPILTYALQNMGPEFDLFAIPCYLFTTYLENLLKSQPTLARAL